MRTKLLRWHRGATWIAGISAFLWALSGFIHPIMVWNTPRPATPFPPAERISLEGAMPLGAVLSAAGIEAVVEARAVEAAGGPFYLLREGARSPRRYFDPLDGTQRPGLDRRRAERLARHYAGDAESPIADLRYVTAFSNDYPEVNRLLPVWRVAFERDDDLIVFVDTGSGRLASMSNAVQSTLAWIFTNVHTWAFLPARAEWVRVLMIGFLVGSLFAAGALAAPLILFRRRHRHRRKGVVRRHRSIAHLAVIPVLMATTSGLFHLLHMSPVSGAVPAAPEPVPMTAAMLDADWTAAARGVPLASLSALALPGAGTVIRFVPAAASQPPIWIDGATGRRIDGGERALMGDLAAAIAGVPRDSIASLEPITGFTDEYGFINKRLPVWRVAIDGEDALRLFIDPADGVLAARVTAADMRESLSFNTLHKWRFLDGLGLAVRDLVIMTMMLSILATAALGWALKRKRSGVRRKEQVPSQSRSPQSP